MSGENTRSIISHISAQRLLTPHRQALAVIRDTQGQTIDRAMIVFHPCPNSYTGEDLAEISCHGNPMIVDRVLDAIADTGLARMAQRGEFTMRAFLNGKMDLIQAEAVSALVGSGSISGCSMAETLLEGGLSRVVKSLREDLGEILADMEASFMTDGDECSHTDDLAGRLEPAMEKIGCLLKDAQESRTLYAGVVTTIAGLPNVGKSSLFNAILGFNRAIVHHEEGTTRDVLKEHLSLSGIDFVFHDTAGIRETTSGPERIGVQRTIEALEGSDLVLYVADAREGVKPREKQWLDLAKRTIIVLNKADLLDGQTAVDNTGNGIVISAKTGFGIEELMNAMKRAFPGDQPLVFLDRHAHLLGLAHESLLACARAASSGLPPDVCTIDLKGAVQYLGELTGESPSEDMLERIFSRFCIGK